MKTVWRSMRGICPACGHKPTLNPLRALLGAGLVLAVLTAVFAVMERVADAQIDGIADRMDARVAQDAK